MIQRGYPYQLFENFLEKKNINFKNIILIFDSIYYSESKEFTFVGISRKKLLFEPFVLMEIDTKGGTLINFLRISWKKKLLILKILYSFLIVYIIASRKNLLSSEYKEKNYFLNTLFEWKLIELVPLSTFWEFLEKKNY